MAETADLQVQRNDRVLTLTMNRPQKLNALSRDMIGTLIAQLCNCVDDKEIGCVLLTGSGRAFCAGGDVSAMESKAAVDMTFEERLDAQRQGHELSRLLHEIPKVTIAAVNGHAVGAGMGIALSCDLRIASDRAKFGTAFARVGFGGDFGITWKLTHLVGEAKAKELFFLPDVVDANEALRVGLVNRVEPHDELETTAQEIARRIAHGPLVSYRYMKENVNLSSTCDFRTMLNREALTQLRCGMTEDHREGVRAFIQKREPEFRGR